MKRVLASVGIFAAVTAASAGMATAESDLAPQRSDVGLVAEASPGSSDLVGNLLRALSTGSAAECDGVMLDVCVPLPTQPANGTQIADSGSATGSVQNVDIQIWRLIGWLGNGSSAPCTGMCFPL
ncbi:hypothetical protein ACFVJ5_14810 [Nocardia sp. NPDC127606]|uniref:hypothetical protein n=1 Tax=Nocardia sp. NPDC127606 TaxID=3345406 RepID=UPI00363E4608